MYWFKEDEAKSLNSLRSAYKKLLIKYHPDNNKGKDTTKEMQEINSEYDRLFKRLKDSFESSESYEKASDRQKQAYDWEKDKQMREIILALSRLKNITIEIIGTWIWVTGQTYPHRIYLKELGMHYCSKKNAWSIHWDAFYKRSRDFYSMEDIRSKYGSIKVSSKDEQKELQEA